jgi:hypothetical protein
MWWREDQVAWKNSAMRYRKKLRKKNKPLALAWVRKELARIVFYVLKDGIEYNNTFRGAVLSRPKKV